MRLVGACCLLAVAVLLLGCSNRQGTVVTRSTSFETSTDEDAVLDWVEALETELRQSPRPFTDDEWTKVKQLCENSDPGIRIVGLYLCGFARNDPNRRSEAIQIAKNLLSDQEPNVRASAILTLHDLDARETASEIKSLLNDADEHVREDANAVLQAWGYSVSEPVSQPTE